MKSLSVEHKEKIALSRMGKKHSKETRLKMSLSKKGKSKSEEHKRKIRFSCIGVKKSPYFSRKRSIIMKNKWKDESYRLKMLLVLKEAQKNLGNLEINKCESRLQDILTSIDSGFEYVGNWKKFVAGKCPDFINEEKKLIIELYGDYWHQDESDAQTERRIDLFAVAGYDTLVIWEKELKKINLLKQKLQNFANLHYTTEEKNVSNS